MEQHVISLDISVYKVDFNELIVSLAKLNYEISDFLLTYEAVVLNILCETAVVAQFHEKVVVCIA